MRIWDHKKFQAGNLFEEKEESDAPIGETSAEEEDSEDSGSEYNGEE